MKAVYLGLLVVLSLVLTGYFAAEGVRIQTARGARRSSWLGGTGLSSAIQADRETSVSWTPRPLNFEAITCSPAPCVLPPTQVSGGGPVNTAPIVADPLHPRHLLVGANDFNCGPLSILGFYTSPDGGATWNHTCLQPNGHYSPDGGFPVVGYDRNGTAYIAGIYFDNGNDGIGNIAFEKSNDSINWSAPAVALGPAGTWSDFPWLAVDTTAGSPYVNSIYVSGRVDNGNTQTVQVSVAHSNDGGSSWSTATVDPPQSFPADDGFTNMTIGKDGTIYVTWQHCLDTGPGADCNNGRAYMLFAKSSDGGTTWTGPRVMKSVTIHNDACHCLWGDLPNSVDISVSNYPVIGVDNSNGPHGGNLYVVMYSWTGTYMRVGVIRSADGGNTWSKPVPVAPPSATHDQFFPWLSVSPTGLVGVSWLDRRNDPANVSYQAFAAISTDGGLSFKPNIQLTKAFSNPNNTGTENDWLGDYTGNTWAGPNHFVAAWMDTSNGVNVQNVVGGIRLK